MAETEFWLLLLTYVKYILSKCKASSVPDNAVEAQVLPLLERFNFLTECTDLRSLSGIFDSLKAEGFVLPISTRIDLASLLVRRAVLLSSSRSEAHRIVDFVKRLLDFNYFALKQTMRNFRRDRFLADNQQNIFMLCAVEESVCGSIFNQDRLLEYALEKENDSSGHGNGDFQKSKLAIYLRNGLQSQNPEIRLSVISLACTCGFNSEVMFVKMLPILEKALYCEEIKIKEPVLSSLMDMIFIHHSSVSLDSVFHFITSFLYSPAPSLQLISVIGCGRLLLYDCYPEETECLLGLMLQRFVYRLPSHISMNGRLQQVDQAFNAFFREYMKDKKLHQDDIANTLVYMSLQGIDEGIVMTNRDLRQIEDNPMKKREAEELHMALLFGMSLCPDALDAVVDSFVLNVNEGSDPCDLNKEKCAQWFLCKPTFT